MQDCSRIDSKEQKAELFKPISLPNFFILGAGKSGTTSLYNYLKDHPEIFLTELREPTFCEDFQGVTNPISYFELFDQVQNESVIGEASHAYLSDPKSAKVLRALFPKAKFLIVLRNPADRAFSLYQHMRRRYGETSRTFEKALILEDERFSSDHFKNNNTAYLYNYMYFRSGLYGQQIQRYFTLFDKRQFHIITLDELKGNFQEVLKAIFAHLDVATDFVIHPKVYNKGYHVRSSRIEKVLNFKIIKYFNRGEIPVISENTKIALMKKFKKDQDLLFELCGIRFM